MFALKILFVLTAVIAVTAAINVTQYKPNTDYYAPTATYADVLKAMNLVNFHLTPVERRVLKNFVNTKSKLEEVNSPGYRDFMKLNNEHFKTVASIKLDHGIEPIPEHQYFNGLMLVLNYDLMAQILDPNYVKTYMSIRLKPSGQYDASIKDVLTVISDRWTKPGLTGSSVDLRMAGLVEFYEGTEEEVAYRRKQVYRLYEKLDEFVQKTLTDSYTMFGPVHTPVIYNSNV